MTRSAIRFSTIDEVVAIHDDALDGHGGLAGIRDRRPLKSAFMTARALGKYLHRDIPARAAAYALRICQAHAFYDGNKQSAVLSGFTFLDNNGYDLTASDDDVITLGLGVAYGTIDKADATIWIRNFSRRAGK